MLNRKIKNFKNYFSLACCWTLVLLIISFSFLCCMIVSFSSDSFYFLKIFFHLLFIWLLWVLIGAHVSSISVAACRIFTCSMQSLSCSMWDLVPWPGIEFRPPVLGAWSLSHYSQANREVSWNWFKLKVQSLEFLRLWNSLWWQQKVLENTEFVILLLMVLFGCTSLYLQRI